MEVFDEELDAYWATMPTEHKQKCLEQYGVEFERDRDGEIEAVTLEVGKEIR